MLGLGNRNDTYNVTGEILKIGDPEQVIIFGESEKTRVPSILQSAKKVDIVWIPGDHHYNGNTGLIVRKLQESHVF